MVEFHPIRPCLLGNDYAKNIDVNAISGITQINFQEVLSQESIEEQVYIKQKEETERKVAEAEQRERNHMIPHKLYSHPAGAQQ